MITGVSRDRTRLCARYPGAQTSCPSLSGVNAGLLRNGAEGAENERRLLCRWLVGPVGQKWVDTADAVPAITEL